MTEFFIPPFPTGLTRSPDPARDRQQGDEPRRAASWGVRLSAEWRLYADGREVPVYSTPVTRGGPHSFAKLRLAQPGLVQPDGTVRFRAVRDSAKPIGSVSVLPSSLGCTPLFEGHEVFFTVSGTGSITLLTDGMDDCPLTVLLLPPRERTPRGSLYFGPGLHTLNWLDLNDGDTLVVDDGAVVTALPPDESPVRASDWAGMPNYRDFIAADHKKNVSVRGGGILDFSLLEWHARNPILFRDCENVTIEDVTLVNAPAWNLDFMGCRGVRADSVSIFGYRENSDWLDHFLTECCETGDTYQTSSGDFYLAYRDFCNRNGEYTRSTTDFYAAIDLAGFTRKRTNKGRVVCGVRLKPDFEPLDYNDASWNE